MEHETGTVRNDAAMAATILLLGLLLAFTGSALLARWQSAATRHQIPMFEDLLGLVATIAGLAIVAWWIAAFLLALASALLQQRGRPRSAGAAARLSPAFMRRLALAILGLNLVGIPLAHAAPAAVEPAWSPTNAAAASIGAPAGWEADSGPAEIEPHWQPRRPIAEPGILGAAQQRASERASPPAQEPVVVTRGDSLWSIAARQLGPLASDVDIALHWPKWYAANRQVIGEDPGLLIPGQILNPPARN